MSLQANNIAKMILASEHKAKEYALSVVNEEIIANKWVKLECKRFLDRLEEIENNPDCPYFFDYKEVKKINGLLALINYATGFYAGEPVIKHMAGFQFFVIHNVFCLKYKENNARVIEECILLISRKAGKTFISALILLILILTGDDYSQFYSVGNTREISGLVKREMENLVKSSPAIKSRFKLNRSEIICNLNDSTYMPLSGEANNLDGKLATAWLSDETANQKDFALISAMKLSQMSLNSRLGILISTAYAGNPQNPMLAQCEYLKKVLDGTIEDMATFGLIFELDEGDSYHNPDVWVKANPLQMSLENGRKFMLGEYKKGLEMPDKMFQFRVKLLNQWLDGDSSKSFLDVGDFQKCRLDEYDWTGKEVIVGADLAQSVDTCSVCMATYDQKLNKYIVKSWTFIPASTVEDRIKLEKVNYHIHKEQGNCFYSGDRVVNYAEIEEFVLSLEAKYGVKIKCFAYDRYNAISTANKIENKGYETVEVKQHSSVLSAPIKMLKECILNGEFGYIRNQLLEIGVGNTREVLDTNLNYYISKKKSAGRIDNVMAMLNCFAVFYDEKINGMSIYETEERSEGFIII